LISRSPFYDLSQPGIPLPVVFQPSENSGFDIGHARCGAGFFPPVRPEDSQAFGPAALPSLWSPPPFPRLSLPQLKPASLSFCRLMRHTSFFRYFPLFLKAPKARANQPFCPPLFFFMPFCLILKKWPRPNSPKADLAFGFRFAFP